MTKKESVKCVEEVGSENLYELGGECGTFIKVPAVLPPAHDLEIQVEDLNGKSLTMSSIRFHGTKMYIKTSNPRSQWRVKVTKKTVCPGNNDGTGEAATLDDDENEDGLKFVNWLTRNKEASDNLKRIGLNRKIIFQ